MSALRAHQYHQMCGCDDCCRRQEAAERHDERVEALAVQFRKDDAALREAEEFTAGTFSPEHYTNVSLALHALHHTNPSDLLGSDVLARLYQLAKLEAAAIDAHLLQQARDYLEMRSAA